jgi:hypothetical protein
MSKRKVESYIPDEEDESIVYFLIICHGMYYFKNEKPDYVKIPDNIQYVNKITYTPFGLYNLEPDTSFVKENVINICNDMCPLQTESQTEELIDLLEKRVKVLERQKYRFNIRQQIKDQFFSNNNNQEPKPNLKTRCYFKMLFDKTDHLYQNVEYSYDTPEKNIPIIQKTFKILPNDNNKELNIYVVFQKNGKLTQGDRILNSDIYLNFLNAQKRGFGLFSQDPNTNIITTQQLLELASFYNYKKAFILDYSCDICKDENGKPYSRDKVMKLRESIRLNLVGRGRFNKKTCKQKKQRNLRVIKKRRKTKKKEERK